MATVESRTYNAHGVLIEVGQIEVADEPATLDLPAIAEQVTQLTDAVNQLILDSLGDF